MSLHLLEATVEDIPELVTMIFETFHRENPVNQLMYPKGLTPSLAEIDEVSMRKDMSDSRARHMKITYRPERPPEQQHSDTASGGASDTNGKAVEGDQEREQSQDQDRIIIGYAKWRFHLEPQPRTGWNAPKQINEGDLGPTDEVNYALATNFMGRLRENRLQNMDAERYIYLSSLATHATYRNLGAGSKLLEWGIRQAESYNNALDCWLQSTASAHAFYRKHGFEDVKSFAFDLTPYYLHDSSTSFMEYLDSSHGNGDGSSSGSGTRGENTNANGDSNTIYVSTLMRRRS